MTIKPKTIGDLREAIKYLHDEIPIYLESGDDPAYFACLSIENKVIIDTAEIHVADHPLAPHKILLDRDKIDALCFHYS